MNFPPPNRRPRRARRWVVLGVAVGGLALLFGANVVWDGRIAALARAPVAVWGDVEATAADGLALASGALTGVRDTQTQREALEERIRELEIYALNNQVLRAENEELRRLLGSSTTTAITSGTVVRVTSHGGVAPYGTLLLDARADAYADGAYVYVTANVAIGTIASASRGFATVDLFSRSGRQVSVIVHTSEGEVAVPATGRGNGNFEAQVPRDVAVAQHDAVVLASRSDALLGYVGAIETSPTDAFKTLRIRTPVNLSTIRFVHVREL